MYEYALVRLMEEKGIRQSDLAKATGITAGSISGYVHGKVDMSAQNVIKLADALCVSTDELLGREKVESPLLDELVEIFSRLSNEEREILVKMARGLL